LHIDHLRTPQSTYLKFKMPHHEHGARRSLRASRENLRKAATVSARSNFNSREIPLIHTVWNPVCPALKQLLAATHHLVVLRNHGIAR
jgi:hypothetical protein